MIMQICTIHDSVAKIYNQPFFQTNKNVAKRTFTDLINDPTTNLARSPIDFNLYSLGEFNDQTGEITLYSKHELIAKGLSVVYDNDQDVTQPITSAINEVKSNAHAK